MCTLSDKLQIYLNWTLHSVDLLYTATQCTVTFVVQWDAHLPVSFNEHPNSWSLRTLNCNTFDRRSYKFPAEHLSLLLEWFTPFLSLLFLLYSILVSSFYLSVNIDVLYQVTVTCIEFWSVKSLGQIKSSRLQLFFDDVPEKIACSRPSTTWIPGTGYREKEWICKTDVK